MRAVPVVRSLARFAALAAAAGLATAAAAQDLCPDDQGTPQFDPADHARCAALWPDVATPSNPDGTPKPLNAYEAAVGEFFNKFCHRDPELTAPDGTGWARDKGVRDTGPYVATRNADNQWVGDYHGFHAPVVIWYSPEMIDWIETNRPADPAMTPAETAPVPDGAIVVKEMYTPPGSRCRGRDIADLKPGPGIAYMIRDSGASQDGWFWGYFGFFDPAGDDPNIDWPPPQPPARPLNAPAYAGFGQYCLNCHASAKDNSTFSSLANIEGQPGEPLVFLSQDWFLTEVETDVPQHVPASGGSAPPIPNSTPLDAVPEAFGRVYALKDGAEPAPVAELTLPSMTYDNVWVQAGTPPPLASEYVTSDQCLGCHDAGSTGLRFDMTMVNPHGDDLINLSPYATWRSSPMGLAGRDPIFFAQLSSEEALHPDYHDLIWNTCLGCHGIMGQRQYQLDQAQAGRGCGVFDPDYVTATPYDGDPTEGPGPHFDPVHAKYGALARDGISCVACHRSVLTPEQTAEFGDQPQNECVAERQQQLNVGIGGLSGFGKTFTGSFLVADTDTLYGPFADPKTKPMEHALGNIPEHDPAIASSEQCGTCHTVHLPVLWPKQDGQIDVLADTYEQTTYPEWAFSDFRTGTAAFLPAGETLPSGAGATPVSCAGCHLESHDANGPFRSKIASIQERTSMPEAENALPADEIDLETRTGFARHTLVGLNLFLVKMAQQFPEVLGIAVQDPMLTSSGMPGLQRTEDEMVANAMQRTAAISVARRAIADGNLEVSVRIDNLAGHKFPSGVSFRRAFVEFEVFGADGATLWHSGVTDAYGVLVQWPVDPDNPVPLNGELWYDAACTKIVEKDDFQPHYQVITRPEQVQIYQEVKLDPGIPGQTYARPQCGEGAPVDPTANMTTSFLSICHTPKDNRLLPAGTLPRAQRVELSAALGLPPDEAEKLADETGATGVGDDPDYAAGGGDTLAYRIALADLADAPARVRATLHYQATPPFFLQDRFCTGSGANRDRLFHLASLLDTKGTPIEDWKFRMVSTGLVPLTE